MAKYLVDLWLDGYESEEQMNEACAEFIYDQLNMTSSGVEIKEVEENINFITNDKKEISFQLTEEKRNKLIEILIDFMKRYNCDGSMKLLRDDDCIMQAPVTLAEMIEILNIK